MHEGTGNLNARAISALGHGRRQVQRLISVLQHNMPPPGPKRAKQRPTGGGSGNSTGGYSNGGDYGGSGRPGADDDLTTSDLQLVPEDVLALAKKKMNEK